MAKYQNRYRIESHRKPDWNYASAGAYFITICIQDMKCILGRVVNARMVLSDFGKIVEAELIKSADMRQELQLGAFVVMPNHIHAIIILNDIADDANIETHGRASVYGHASVRSCASVPYRRPKSISSFVAGFKSAVVSAVDDFIDEQAPGIPKYNRRNKFWQSNYHDHIIRNWGEYDRIAQYIHNNPCKWQETKYSK